MENQIHDNSFSSIQSCVLYLHSKSFKDKIRQKDNTLNLYGGMIVKEKDEGIVTLTQVNATHLIMWYSMKLPYGESHNKWCY